MNTTVIEIAAALPLEVTADTQWIELFPAGTSMGRDGRGPYHLTDAAFVIQNSLRPKVELFIDRDHQAVLAPPGTPVRAAGWIKDMEDRDGAVWGRIDWTASARTELEAKEYRYISPVFKFDKETRVVTAILHASLTNDPNLEVTAVASARHPHLFASQSNQPEEPPMDKTLIAVASAIGLPETATAEDILAGVKTLAADKGALATEIASVRMALKLDGKADVKTVVETASQLVSSAQIDLTKYVPMDVHLETASQLTLLQKETATAKATEAVEAAMAQGKIAPAQKEWAIGYASQDLPAFNEFASKAPVIVSGGATITQQAASASASASAALSDEEIAICSQLNISREDFIKARKAETAQQA